MIKNIFYGWWIALACAFIGFYTGGIVFYGFTAFFEPLVKEFGWSYTQVSFAASLRGLEMGILAPLFGFLVDRFGPRRLIFCGIVTVGLGLIFLSFTQSLAMFYCSFMLLSFGAGGCMAVVLITAVANWFDKKVGKALGMVACGFGAGGLTIPLIIRLIDLYHWRTTLVILALGLWILGIPLSFIIRDKPEQYGFLPDGDLSQNPVHSFKKGKNVEVRLKDALKQRAFLYLVLSEVIRMMIILAVVTHIMPYLSSVGMPRQTAGMVAAAIPLFSLSGRIVFGWLGDIFDKRHMMAIALCLTGMGMLAFCYVQERWVVFPFLLFFPLGLGGGVVLRGAILREYFGIGFFGKILGLVAGFASIGGIIGPTLAGWVFDILGSYYFVWLASLGFIGIAIILILKIEPKISAVQNSPNI